MVELAATGTQTTAADLAWLRRFEPVVQYTRGEEFLPIRVDSYVEACSLWVHHPDGHDELLVEKGQLTLETLAVYRQAPFGAVHFLKFIEPLTIAELAELILARGRHLRDPSNAFSTGLARLARVGYGSRLLDALFSLSLLLRGRVPGDAAAAAVVAGRRIRDREPDYVYHGRVVRENGWIALQYWFFYHFNDWRSGFHGANDHEADWEMITVYAYQTTDGQVEPRWVAYANHDFHGDDLRRRWDDYQEMDRVGEHPVVYAGAGSHAAYFRPGEYLTEVEIQALQPVIRILSVLRAFWVRTLRQAGANSTPSLNVFRIPFIDYARGDGVAIGEGQERRWTPVLLDPVPAWVSEYRGLWGVDVRDPLAGENAPSGPMYNRDGTVRQSWYDPVGWAGLDKVPTPASERVALERRRDELLQRRRKLTEEIDAKSAGLMQLGSEAAALQGNPHLKARFAKVQDELKSLAIAVRQLRNERTHDEAVLKAVAFRLGQIDRGEPDDPRAHIHRLALPATAAHLRMTRLVEAWAAGSIGIMLVCLVLLLLFGQQYLVSGLAAMVGAFLVIESVFRRQVARLISTATIALAIISALVLVYDFFWGIVILGVVIAAIYLTWENIREIRG